MRSTVVMSAAGAFVLALAMAGPNVYADDQSMERSTSTSFNDMDKDRDGYLTKREAANSSHLVQQWEQADRDANQQIDRSEFSAFESKAQKGSGRSESGTSGSGSGSERMQD